MLCGGVLIGWLRLAAQFKKHLARQRDQPPRKRTTFNKLAVVQRNTQDEDRYGHNMGKPITYPTVHGLLGERRNVSCEDVRESHRRGAVGQLLL